MFSVQTQFSVLRGAYPRRNFKLFNPQDYGCYSTDGKPCVLSVRYNAFYQTLSVTFEDGNIDHYLLVPVNTYLDLIDSKSPDDYFRSCIQGHYIRAIKS